MGRRSSSLMFGMLAVAGCTATAAFAADLPVAPVRAAPAYYPPPPAHYNWSGIYFGGHVGAGLMQDHYTFPVTTVMNAPAGFTTGTLPAGTTTSVSPYSVIGGAQVGANLQFGPAVVGVEGTWTSSAISGNQTAPLTGGGSEQSRSASHWYATATGKLGFAANDWLFYAKGGGAWMRVDYTQSALNGPGNANPVGAVATFQTLSANRSGWTAGVGTEFAFNENLSAKLEYDYLNFGSAHYVFPNIAAGGLQVNIKSQTHMFLAGMNYRFYFGGY